ncbi:MAG TPA: RDD family protein, partial [Cyclobacteriaceae bacterium]
MKSIEVKTTQNVTLEYELADLRDRVVAFIIDTVILGVAMLFIAMIGIAGLRLEGTAATILFIFVWCI